MASPLGAVVPDFFMVQGGPLSARCLCVVGVVSPYGSWNNVGRFLKERAVTSRHVIFVCGHSATTNAISLGSFSATDKRRSALISICSEFDDIVLQGSQDSENTKCCGVESGADLRGGVGGRCECLSASMSVPQGLPFWGRLGYRGRLPVDSRYGERPTTGVLPELWPGIGCMTLRDLVNLRAY